MNFKQLLFILLVSLVLFFALGEEAKAEPLAGFAWSETVGWMSFSSLNCDADGSGFSDGTPPGCPSAGTPMADYGVDVDLATGLISGYSWTENIGWITFNSAELGGCPTAPCNAQLDIDGTQCGTIDQVCGWARALANGGGWDGWIKLRGTNPASVNITTLIDTVGIVGQYTSLAIGADNNPVISYYEASNTALKVAKCNDPACAPGGETITRLDAGNVGQYTSLAIGADNNPVISYYDSTSGNLKVAKCNDPACAPGGETIITVDSTGSVGQYTSLAIGSDDFPVISYYDATNTALKVAKQVLPGTGIGCTSPDWTCTTVDNAAIVGQYTSLAIGADNNPVISYYDVLNADLKVTKCNDPACAPGGETIITIDSAGVGQYTSLAIGADNNPVISYYDVLNADLKVTKCGAPDCIEIPSGDYGVSLNTTPDPDEFEGWAWGSDVVGWVSFNCSNQGVCLSSDYKVFININPPSAISLDATSGDYCAGSCIGAPPVFLSWTFSDPDLGDFQSAYQVQVDDSGVGFPSPEVNVCVYDSTEISNPIPGTCVAGSGGSPSYSPPLSFGTPYDWQVRVWDSFGLSSIFATGPSFTTSPRPPCVNFTFTPSFPAVDEIVQFCSRNDGAACPTDETTFYGTPGTETWAWDFEDGTTCSGPPLAGDCGAGDEQNPTHSYSTEGFYTVQLTATDTGGSCSFSLLTPLTVTPPLPEWKEIAPTGFLSFPKFVFQNLKVDKLLASIFSF